MRNMLQMASILEGGGGMGGMGGAGLGGPLGNPFGQLGGAGGFPAPGVPNTGATSPGATPATDSTTGSVPTPFNMFTGVGAGAGAGATGAGAGLPPFNTALMQQILAGGGGPFGGLGGGFGGGLGGLGGTPPAPADTRPPEERFQVQLQVRPTFQWLLSRLTAATSNCKTWDSQTPLRTSGLSWLRAVTFTLLSSIFSAEEGCNLGLASRGLYICVPSYSLRVYALDCCPIIANWTFHQSASRLICSQVYVQWLKARARYDY